VLANRNQLPCEFEIFKVEQLVLLHSAIQILLVRVVLLESIVKHLVLVVVVHRAFYLN
jgi:hypothetical protein